MVVRRNTKTSLLGYIKCVFDCPLKFSKKINLVFRRILFITKYKTSNIVFFDARKDRVIGKTAIIVDDFIRDCRSRPYEPIYLLVSDCNILEYVKNYIRLNYNTNEFTNRIKNINTFTKNQLGVVGSVYVDVYHPYDFNRLRNHNLQIIKAIVPKERGNEHERNNKKNWKDRLWVRKSIRQESSTLEQWRFR